MNFSFLDCQVEKLGVFFRSVEIQNKDDEKN